MWKEQKSYISRGVLTGQKLFSERYQNDIKGPPELRSPTEYRDRRGNIYPKKTEI